MKKIVSSSRIDCEWPICQEQEKNYEEYQSHFENVWALFEKHGGPFDLFILCDGRSRKARRFMEDAVVGKPHVSEFWVLYAGNGKNGMSERKVALSAANRETLNVVLPCARTALPVQERSSFNATGEDSTHFSSSTGVPVLTPSAMAKVTPADKQAILG